jgi:uncharacterized damage-inducible protein DinB
VEQPTRFVQEDLARYYQHLGNRVERAARALPADKLWVKPFPFGNSVGNLVLHLTGNLNHYIGALIAGSGYLRDRAKEFSDPGPYPLEQILPPFREAVAMVVKTLQAQSEADLARPVGDQKPIQTRFGLFLLCAAHLNNHIGQMSYLVQALGHSTQEPPSW